MVVALSATIPNLEEFKRDFEGADEVLFQGMKKGFSKIGRYDIAKIRNEQLSGPPGLTAKAEKFKKSFISRTSGGNINALTLKEYTGWRAAQIFQEGGTVTAKGGALFIPFPGAVAEGKKLQKGELTALISSGQLQIAKTKNGLFVIQKIGKVTRWLGHLVRSVHQLKRLSFFENFQSNDNAHQEILDTEIDKALHKIARK